jgi:hypothetical protein
MTRLSIQLPDRVTERIAQRAIQAGHSGAEGFIEAMLQAQFDEEEEDWGAPESVTFHSEEELNAILLKRVNDPGPGIKVTPEFWEELRLRLSGETPPRT